MFIPPHFAENDPAKLRDLIERYSFGLLVSQVDGEPFATHLPFLFDRAAGPHGALLGHMARANPHWRALAGTTALAAFSGPHSYVSPTWYEADNMVPTWNYVAVHAYGRVEVIEDRAALLDVVKRSAAVYEAAMPRPWTLDGKPAFADRLLDQIVGFRIRIDRLEGKWKLNQNHPAERRAKVAAALRERGGDDAAAVADLIEEGLQNPNR